MCASCAVAYDRRIRLPQALVEELARTTSLAQPEWVAARGASDFQRFRPWLEKIVQLKRDESACLCEQPAKVDRQPPREPVPSGASTLPCGAMLFRPTILCSTTTSPAQRALELASLFQALRLELVPLVATIAEACRRKTATGFTLARWPGLSSAVRRCDDPQSFLSP